MKTLILLLLIISTSYAREYKCYKRNYEVSIDLQGDKSTHMWLINTFDYSVITQAYAGSITEGKRVKSFHFYGQHEPVIISFRKIDILNQQDSIKAHIESIVEGFILKGYMDCKANR